MSTIDFIGKRWIAFVFSIILLGCSAFLLVTRGLNFGIDFTGGILVETRFEASPDLSLLRGKLQKNIVGDVSLQSFGGDKQLLIRVGNQEGDEKARLQAVKTIKSTLEEAYPGAVEYRKVDYVGPKVGKELIQAGGMSLLFAFIAILLYIWFRFEWQYGVGAVLALFHDAFLTLGFFSLLQLEFNLSSIAAILTIIGYSINDSVVIFDRIRENMRKYKKLALEMLLNRSIHDNLTRTILTSLTTLLALAALALVGGDVIRSFSLAALFGVVVGTYSSIYVASPVLIYMRLNRSELAVA